MTFKFKKKDDYKNKYRGESYFDLYLMLCTTLKDFFTDICGVCSELKMTVETNRETYKHRT